jgi:membrane protein implicated in regulation of membrane protease activity
MQVIKLALMSVFVMVLFVAIIALARLASLPNWAVAVAVVVFFFITTIAVTRVTLRVVANRGQNKNE